MEFDVHNGLVYSRADQDLKLDLFRPHTASESIPCIVVIQGGGFHAQDGQRFRPFAEHLAKNGFGAALIQYRGTPDHTYLETIADIKAAVRFVRKTAPEYGFDPDRIGAMGRSAGATLVALLAVSGDFEACEGGGESRGVSSRIQAAVGIAGVYDFVARFTDAEEIALQPNVATKIKTNGAWIGTPFSTTDTDWLRASPINHVAATDPPMLLLHSKNDETVPWPQSQRMYTRMIESGIAAEIEYSDEGGHGGPATSKDSMVRFFDKTLNHID